MTSDLLLEKLMSEYGDMVLKICYLYLKDYHLAEDAVQETFLKVLKSYDTFLGNSSERTWITRIAINCCKNIRRTRWFQYCRNELTDISHTDGQDVSEEVVEKSAVLSAVFKLQASDREIIFLYYYEELKVEEIAKIIDKSKNATIQRLYRARKRLEKYLLEAGYGR